MYTRYFSISNSKSVGVFLLHWVQLTLRQHILQVVRHKFDLALVVLQFKEILALRLALSLLQCENSVIQELAEGVVEKFADGHLLVFVGVLNILQHVSEHVLGVARFGTSAHRLEFVAHHLLLARIEIYFLLET